MESRRFGNKKVRVGRVRPSKINFLVYRPELEKISARAVGFYFYFLFFAFQRSVNRPTKELLNKVADVQEFERQCEKQMGVHGLLFKRTLLKQLVARDVRVGNPGYL